MKKFSLIVSIFLILISSASAEMPQDQRPNKEEKFSEQKQQMISNLNEQKAAIDQTISCVNSAQDRQSLQKCHEIREAAMQKMHEREIANRRERLQNELKMLDEREQKMKTRKNNPQQTLN